MIEVMTPHVPDRIIERIGEEGPASFIPTSIRPVFSIRYKCREARCTEDTIFLCQLVAHRVTHDGFEVVIGEPPGRIEGLLERDEL